MDRFVTIMLNNGTPINFTCKDGTQIIEMIAENKSSDKLMRIDIEDDVLFLRPCEIVAMLSQSTDKAQRKEQ